MKDNELTEQYIQEHRTCDVRQLALSQHPDGVDMQYALSQITGWQTAHVKVPSWAATDGIIYPPRLSLEQCTSQYVAEYKTGVIERVLGHGFRMADITGGMGVDCYTISRTASRTCYNELSCELCDTARHNFRTLGRHDIEVTCDNATVFLSSCPTDSMDLIYIDPARRGDAGRKLISMRDCQPDITTMQEELFRVSHHVMVKLSPMLDIDRALTELQHVSHVMIIGFEGECKEITLILERGYCAEPLIEAIDIQSDGRPGMNISSYKSANYALPLPIIAPHELVAGTYISEPSAPYMKSALFRTIAFQTGTALLHPDTHLFWSSSKPKQFPGRIFCIEKVIPFDKRSLAPLFKSQANLSVRNFPQTVSQLKSRLKLRDGGSHYLIATTITDHRHLLLDLHRLN